MEKLPGGSWFVLGAVWLVLLALAIGARKDAPWAAVLVIPATPVLTTAMWLFVQRSAEADLRALGLGDRLDTLGPKTKVARLEAGCGLLLGATLMGVALLSIEAFSGVVPWISAFDASRRTSGVDPGASRFTQMLCLPAFCWV